MITRTMVIKILWFLLPIMVLGFLLAGAAGDNTFPRSIHQVKFFDQQTFYEGIDKTKSAKPFLTHITGGIIPHHLFAGFIIADFFYRLSPQQPKTIILLGPNHFEKGNFKVLTSLYSWDTPFGVVDADEEIIMSLIFSNLIKLDEEVLPNDHAVSGIMPFIKYYLPQAKVVPILLSGKLNKNDSAVLANSLSKFITKDAVVVAAVDFSHYLTSSQAKKKDQTTLAVMKDFDYKQLYLLNNDYLDSPPSIGALLMVMQNLGTTKMDLLYHSNSGEMQKNDYIETTSYFEIAFWGLSK